LTDEALIQPLRSSEDGIAALLRYFSDLSDWITRDGRQGCMLINLMAEDGGKNPAFAARAKRYRNRVKQSLRVVLDTASKRGEIYAGDNESRAMILIGLTLGLNIAARFCASPDELKQMTDAIQNQIQSWCTTA
jgi:TetR/AcrR family transcriptional repressor of nem operon